jgi:hypothetical protein
LDFFFFFAFLAFFAFFAMTDLSVLVPANQDYIRRLKIPRMTSVFDPMSDAAAAQLTSETIA